MAKWNFQVSFSDFNSLVLLSTLLRWIIFGKFKFKYSEDKARQRFVKMTAAVMTQAVTQSFMTKLQATYKPQSSDDSFVYSKIESLLNVGIGLCLHQTTRSEKPNDMFDSLNLCINYDKVLDIKKDINNAILKKGSENNGVFN